MTPRVQQSKVVHIERIESSTGYVDVRTMSDGRIFAGVYAVRPYSAHMVELIPYPTGTDT